MLPHLVAPGERPQSPSAAPRWAKLAARVALGLAVAAVYYGSAKLGLTMAFVAEQVTAVWPPTGIAIAVILLFGSSAWPGIALGAFLANITTSTPVGVALAIATGNTLEAITAALLLRHVVRLNLSLEGIRDVIGLIVCAVVVAPVVSASIGVASLCLGGLQPWAAADKLCLVWWIGDAMGALVMAPLILTWATTRNRWSAEQLVEAAALASTLLVAALAVFGGLFTRAATVHPLIYIIFPFVIWAALRFGQAGATAVTFLASAIAIWGTAAGRGPFAEYAFNERLILLLVYMAIVGVTGLLLGAAITGRRQAEEALRLADRRKDEFLAMLAHELRNPLGAIDHAAQLLLRPEGTENLAWSRDVIERQARHLARLVDDLLDVSRITRGKVELRRCVCDPVPVLRHAAEAVRPLIAERRHELEIAFSPEPLWVEADPTRLEQIVVNLLTNAAKYTEAGGHITLTAYRDAADVVFKVQDTGMGIPAEHLPRIFELFAQADRSLARSAGGLGLGLTIVQKLVEMHGGSITAQSEGQGQGSEFVVRLPAAHPAAPPTASAGEAPQPSAAARREAQPARILVVDDSLDSAQALARLLALAGHEVRTAENAEQAMAVARALRPNVVLLDLGLPGTDGYQLARQIRTEPWGASSLLVALTGYGQEEDRKRSREAGFDHHLVKPVEYQQLITLIGRPEEVPAHPLSDR